MRGLVTPGFTLLSGVALALQIATATAQDAVQAYDVVINNGRVMDPETNFDGVRNVGIKGPGGRREHPLNGVNRSSLIHAAMSVDHQKQKLKPSLQNSRGSRPETAPVHVAYHTDKLRGGVE